MIERMKVVGGVSKITNVHYLLQKAKGCELLSCCFGRGWGVMTFSISPPEEHSFSWHHPPFLICHDNHVVVLACLSGCTSMSYQLAMLGIVTVGLVYYGAPKDIVLSTYKYTRLRTSSFFHTNN